MGCWRWAGDAQGGLNSFFFILFMHSRRGKAPAVLFAAAPQGPVQGSTADHKAAKRANLQTHYSDLH